MAGIKSLAKDTAIYGMSSIVGKFLNWCLTPLYTYLLVPEEYGTVVNLYAWMGLLLVLLTYGMETGFFRFANDPEKGDAESVFATGMISIGASTLLFAVLARVFLTPAAQVLHCGAHREYAGMMAAIVALDVLGGVAVRIPAIPIAPDAVCRPEAGEHRADDCLEPVFPRGVSRHLPEPSGVGGVVLQPGLRGGIYPGVERHRVRGGAPVVDAGDEGCPMEVPRGLLREMLRYSFPLLVLGLAGIMNQNLDKILYAYLVPDQTEAMNGLGIYGANAKIAVVMIMFTQAFRYAYEPFIFARTKGEDKRTTYALAMKWFVIVDLLIFLGVMFYLDVLRYFIDPRYFEGLKVVPVIMMAELFSGVFFNLSLWYKLTDRTQWGIYFSVIGLAVIVAGNVLLVPRYGYVACAWAAFACYFVMMFLSWLAGQKYYPIRYDLRGMGRYALLAMVLYVAGTRIPIDNLALRLAFRTVLLAGYAVYLIRHDLPLGAIPVINRWARKDER